MSTPTAPRAQFHLWEIRANLRAGGKFYGVGVEQVFISYASADRAKVNRLVTELRAEGFTVWWDRDVPATAPWEQTIVAVLEGAKCVIVCWSDVSTRSENVRAETRPARAKGKLIQVFLENCEPPPFFGERQGVDLSDWQGDRSHERFRFLVEGVRDVIARRKPKMGLGYQPRERGRGGLATLAVAGAVLLAAAVGVMWIPEVRERVFPAPELKWTMATGTNIDFRPVLSPESAPFERITSGMWIMLHPTFALEGGQAGEGTVSVEKLSLQIPGAEPQAFTWLWFTDDSPDGYVLKRENTEPLRLKDGVGGREVLFQPDDGFRWDEFMAAVGSAVTAGATELVVELNATVMSSGKAHQLKAVCAQPLDSLQRQLAMPATEFRSIIGTCRPASEASSKP